MRHFIILLGSILLLSVTSCKSKKKTEASGSTDKSSAKTEAVATCAVKVSFGSMGSGIDTKKYDEIKSLIDSKKLKYTEKNMGREGEKEICLPLSELKAADKSAFIEQLKKTASDGQLVSVSTD